MQGTFSHDENDIRQKYVTKRWLLNDRLRKIFSKK